MIDKINDEIEKFSSIYHSMENSLPTTLLASIAAYLCTKQEKDGKFIANFEDFDKTVEEIKNMINSVDIDIIPMAKYDTLVSAIKNDIEQAEKCREECLFSVRSFQWIKDELENTKEGE